MILLILVVQLAHHTIELLNYHQQSHVLHNISELLTEFSSLSVHVILAFMGWGMFTVSLSLPNFELDVLKKRKTKINNPKRSCSSGCSTWYSTLVYWCWEEHSMIMGVSIPGVAPTATRRLLYGLQCVYLVWWASGISNGTETTTRIRSSLLREESLITSST